MREKKDSPLNLNPNKRKKVITGCDHSHRKTQWAITHNIPIVDFNEQNGLYMGCWIPSNSDPVGEFSLEISIGNTTFPTVKFALME